VQLVDYRNPTSDASIKLITAVHELLAQQTPLPEPLPEQPPVPYEYLMWLAATMRDAELSAAQQAKLVAELKSGLEEDGNDPWARGEIMRLWRELRDRSDVTYETGTERQSGVRRLLRPVMWVGLLVAAVAVVAVVAWAIDGHALALIFTASVIGMVLALSALIWWRLERSNAHPADASQLPPVRPPLPPVPPPPVFETEPDRAPGASGTGPQPSPLQPPLASEAAEDVPGDRLTGISGRGGVVLTWDQAVIRDFWLLREYLPEACRISDALAVSVDTLVELLEGAQVQIVPVPHDCTDGFAAAYWRRPQAYLDPTVRAGISMLAKTGETALTEGLTRLAADMRSGA